MMRVTIDSLAAPPPMLQADDALDFEIAAQVRLLPSSLPPPSGNRASINASINTLSISSKSSL
jgi:hypothetical protein